MTTSFKEGISKVLNLTVLRRITLMCAEQLHWRCHRRIISDYLKMKGHAITHIVDKGKTEEHELTSFAKIVNGELRRPK